MNDSRRIIEYERARRRSGWEWMGSEEVAGILMLMVPIFFVGLICGVVMVIRWVGW